MRRTELYKLLNGLISIYKPPSVECGAIIKALKAKLTDEFNSLPTEAQSVRTIVNIENDIATKRNILPSILSVPDIVDSPLVLGRRFMPTDFVLYPIDPLDYFVSGVQILGIGVDGVYTEAEQFEHAVWMKTYHLHGVLGRATTDGTANSSTLLRTTWRHVTRPKLDRLLASLQARFRASALLHAGLQPNTQKAYEVLAQRRAITDLRPQPTIAPPDELDLQKHLLSPWDRRSEPGRPPTKPVYGEFEPEDENRRRQHAPYINAIRCVHFRPPDFTIEIQLAHEDSTSLVNLVANLGPSLRTATYLQKARRIRHGRITLRDSLLLKQCSVPPILLRNLADQLDEEANRIDPPPIDGDESSQSKYLLKGLIQRTGQIDPNVFSNLYRCAQLHPMSIVFQPKLLSM